MITRHRVLLVSDMHYTTDEMNVELRRIYPNANTSAAAGDAFGHTQREKIEKVYEAVIREHQKSPLDAVLVLGDLSIDDYSFRNLPLNYCKQFKIDCMDRLPCPSYAIPGNHDSYPDEIWQEIFGNGRQFEIELGDAVFLMADTFRTVPATSASGASVTPLDVDFLRGALEKHAGKRIFLCAHHLSAGLLNEEARDLIKNSTDLVCSFRGHTHINCVTSLGEACGEKPLIDIGGYGYMGQKINEKWTFSVFDHSYAWGYQILEWDDRTVHTYHVKPKMHYVGSNGVFDVEETVSGERSFTIDR